MFFSKNFAYFSLIFIFFLSSAGGQLCESILLSYGSLMLSHPSLWQFGIDYLDACPTEGKGRLEALLSCVPFKTNQKSLKIAQIAAERGLNDVGKFPHTEHNTNQSSISSIFSLHCGQSSRTEIPIPRTLGLSLIVGHALTGPSLLFSASR